MNLLFDPALALAADIVDDIERVRIANQNRFDTLTRDTEDADGEIRGFGLPVTHPDVVRLAAMIEVLRELEHDAVLNLQRKMRAHALGPWVKSRVGVGEKQAARLLAVIGDPYWNTLFNKPRTVAQLWAYSGLHVVPGVVDRAGDSKQAAGGDIDQKMRDAQMRFVNVAPRRRRGERANWSTRAKMRAYLIAESCIKQARSPYRAVYDARRAQTTVTHADWTPGHSHNDALRVTSKAILRDLWIAAATIHGARTHEPGDRPALDEASPTQDALAVAA